MKKRYTLTKDPNYNNIYDVTRIWTWGPFKWSRHVTYFSAGSQNAAMEKFKEYLENLQEKKNGRPVLAEAEVK